MSKQRNVRELPTRQVRGLQRQPRLLIVTEDAKAAPRYFREIRFDAGFGEERVTVNPPPGSDPLTVAQYLIRVWDDEARGLLAGELPFERAFCVVDRDTHDWDRFTQAKEQLRQKDENVRQAVQDAGKPDPGEVFCFALSEPCFEYWLLLHYRDTRAPFAPTGTKSPCDDAISQVKTAGLTGYAKGAGGLWARTKPLYETAKQRAIQGRRAAATAGTTNPVTYIDEVVESILNLP